jgi:hypothetical protein
MSWQRKTGIFLGFTFGFVVTPLLVYTGVLIGARGHGTRGEWLSFAGSMMGASVTVIGALLVVGWQTVADDYRKRRTMLQLIEDVWTAGSLMAQEEAALDPARYTNRALFAYQAVKSVASERRSESIGFARVAQQLEGSTLLTHLVRLHAAQGGIAAADLQARGKEMMEFARDLRGELLD